MIPDLHASASVRPIRAALRLIAAAFGIGLLLALTASGGIAEERVTRGAFSVGLIASTAATIASVIAVVVLSRRMRAPLSPSADGAPRDDDDVATAGPWRGRAFVLLLPQLLGAGLGIALVHVVLRSEAVGVMPWLSEKPAQLMNDVVAVSGLLALVWACASGLDARILVFAFLGITLYRVTSPLWHLDLAPGGFQSTVQQLVVAQFVAAAMALGVFRATLDRR